MSVGIQTPNGILKVAGSGLGANPMTGATENTNGKAGLVPAPTTSDVKKFLRGDGTWVEISSTTSSTTEPTENLTEGMVWIE